MIKRIYIEKLKKLLTYFPVVAVIGARQVGKTTLCKHLIGGKRKYFNLDDITILNIAQKHPEVLLDVEGDIIIDEVQRAPSLLLEIKKRVDTDKKIGKYLLTGSANIELLPKLQETLAGRIAFLEMFPVTLYEKYGHFEQLPGIVRLLKGERLQDLTPVINQRINIMDEILYGTYPEPMLKRDHFYSQTWFNGYVKTYLERDVRTLSNIQSLGDYQRVLSLAALRIGSLLSLSELAKDCGVPLMTLKRYLNLLLISYQYHQLPPFFRNIGKRFVKAPKLYSFDGGLSAHLLGILNIIDIDRLNRSGALFENRIITELKALLTTYTPNVKMFFYNTHGGGEIDIILQSPGQLIPIEIKLSSSLKKINTKTIENFMTAFPNETNYAIIISQAEQLIEIKKNIFIVPYQYLLQ